MTDAVQGTEALDLKFAFLIDQVGGPGLDKALFEGGLVLERAVKKNIQVKRLILTGNYRASIATDKRQREVWVGTNVVYAKIHEYGGTITARRAPFLVFFYKGQWRKVRSVRIPARPHWRPAILQSQRAILKAIDYALLRQIKRVTE